MAGDQTIGEQIIDGFEGLADDLRQGRPLRQTTFVRVACQDCDREWDRCPVDRTADSVAEAVGYGWVCQGTGHRCPECVAERQGGSE